MQHGRALAAGLTAAILVAVAGCTAQQLRDFQARFASATDAETLAEQQPEKLGQCSPQFSTQALSAPSYTPAQRALTMGVWMYEDGDYVGAESYLKTALSLDVADAERVRAHKYLAFILCAERRQQECRREFREAIAIDPKFQLTPAEQGHPSWGPVFRALKPTSAAR
jgi:tetratricopeptide (TPR) repeat protein